MPGIPLHGASSSRESTRGTNHLQKTSHLHYPYVSECFNLQDLSLSANLHLWVRHSF